MSIGESGSLTASTTSAGEVITVTFTDPITDPVIVLSGTSNGGDPYTLRVVDTTLDANGDVVSFDFLIEEWEYLDGPHPAQETINWLAIEEGVHTLPDGRVIEAGTSSVDEAGASVAFNGDFGDTPPVVLTSVMSENDTTAVDSDPLNITSGGFDIELQEEEAEDDDHGVETIGWIAVQPGGSAASGTASTVGGVDENPDTLDLGDTFTDAVVLVETQTINGGDAATTAIESQTNSTVDVFVREEQSNDNETNHVNETIGVVSFEDGLIPCFTPGALILTEHGPKPVETLQAGDRLITRDSGPQPLRWVCRRTLSAQDLAAQPQHRPVILRAGSLGPGLPDRDMTVSPQHRMLLDGWRAELLFGVSEVLVPAKGLLNDNGVVTDRSSAPVTYIHLLLDRHHVICSNGTWTESLHAGELGKDMMPHAAREELFALFPNLRAYAQSYGATARPVATVREAGAL